MKRLFGYSVTREVPSLF